MHVDDLILAGDNDELIKKIKKTEQEISCMEKNKFRFTGLNIMRETKGNIGIIMEAYAKMIVKIPMFRKEIGSMSLNEDETSVFRGYVGKLCG